ncbi:MAG TPA: thioredoxin family protein [Bacilli bacterium]|nr:thioredoxin family protein [Bacilli bacterium]
MRFKKLIAFGALISTLLFSCNFNDPQITKFSLSSVYYEKAELAEVTKEEFNDLLTAKDSFIIYQYLESCMACYQFTPVLNEFILDQEITVLKINAFSGGETILKNYATIVPTLFLFEKGGYVTHLDPTKSEHAGAFTSASGLTLWLEKYVNLAAPTSE